MSKIQTAAQLVAACKKVATQYETLYVLGCIGAPMTLHNKNRYTNNLAYNAKAARKKKIMAASVHTFGFDCVCLIKSLLWGWEGDEAKTYGGAVYGSNGVPDIGADLMIKACSHVSTDFSTIQPGEAVWMKGHIGLYIGDGLAVECTPKWGDGVQITAVHNIGKKAGYNGRKWTSHGKLPWITYENVSNSDTTPEVDYTLGMRYLKEGCEGEDVRALQILLNANDCPCGNADGIFGSKTATAVKQFQASKSLLQDAIVGSDTMSTLLGVST